jgi:hypothetical protein
LLTDKDGRLHAEPFPDGPEDAAGETERP